MNFPQPYHSPFDQIKNLVINRVILQRTGAFKQQYLRPYNLTADAQAVSLVQEVVGGSTRVSPSMLSGVANRFFKPASTPESAVAIPNGWETPRMRFAMEIQYERGGMQHMEMVLGYTEHAGDATIQSNLLDPHMRFFVNSIVSLRQSVILTPTGKQTNRVISDNSHVLFNPNWQRGISSVADPNTVTQYRLRPQDMFGVMGTNSELGGIDTSNLIDGRIINMDQPVLSSRSNNAATNYMARLMDGYSAAVNSGDGTDNEIYANAMGMVRDNMISHTVFLNKLQQQEGSNKAAFTVGELESISPGVTQRIKVVQAGSAIRTSAMPSNSADFHGATIEDQIIATISQAVPAMMMEYGIAKVVVLCTNHQVDGKMSVQPMHGQTFSGGNMQQPCEMFARRLEAEVLRDVTYNNQIGFYLHGSFDLQGQSIMELGIDGQAVSRWEVPTFADALLPPVVTQNRGLGHAISSSMENLLSNIGFGHYGQAGSFQEPGANFGSNMAVDMPNHNTNFGMAAAPNNWNVQPANNWQGQQQQMGNMSGWNAPQGHSPIDVWAEPGANATDFSNYNI